MVTAPWLILKKSKEKWEEATLRLTDLFWSWADHEVGEIFGEAENVSATRALHLKHYYDKS